MIMQLWPLHMIKRLRELAAEGHRASDIARMIGHGLTKNAVIGKCWREGIKLNSKPGPKPEDCRRNTRGQFAQKEG